MSSRRGRPAAGGDNDAASRSERKQRTRTRLMDAALKLIGEGRSFTGLGLREITREAGVVPTSFYRHFRDMEELGLALVEDSGLTLRRMLRDARRDGVPGGDIIRHSVRLYMDHLEANRLSFQFIAGERLGGSPHIRRAIRNEVSHFANEMALDLLSLNLLPRLSSSTLQTICGLVVNTMLNAAGEILDLPPGQPALKQELVETLVRQLRLIFLGAGAWREPTR